MNIVSWNQILFVIWIANTINRCHMLAGKSTLVDGLQSVLNLLKLGHVELLSAWFSHLFEGFFKQFPYFYVSLVCGNYFLVFSLSPEPNDILDGFGDLLTFQWIKLPTVRLELCVVLQSLCFFCGILWSFEDDYTTCMIAQC